MNGESAARPRAEDQDTEIVSTSAFSETADQQLTVPLGQESPTQREPVRQTLAYTMFEPQEGEPLNPRQLRRFGPGVPGASVPGEVAAIWRGQAPRDRKRRRRALAGWLLPFVILIVVLAVLLWRRTGSPLAVTGASVRATPTIISCNATATITGTLQTNGEAGSVAYQWKRSDGTVSDVLEQQVAKGTRQVEVSLLWTFNGKGAVHATATLVVLSPAPTTADSTFTYSCE